MVVTAASNTNPVVVTVSGALPADFLTGVIVDITGVLGNTAANGQFAATVTGASTFSIPIPGTGAYVSGGSVQPLNMSPFFQIPSDGDLDNEASIDNWAKATGDRTQFLVSKIGAYKLVSHDVLANISDGGAVPPQIATPWAKNSTTANSLDRMVLQAGGPMQFLLPALQSFDVAEVSLQTTLGITCAGVGASSLAISMAFGYGPYAAPPVVTSGALTHNVVHAKYSGSSVTDYYPLSLSAKLIGPFPYSDSSISGFGIVSFWCDTYGVVLTANFAGDSLLIARRYRPTGVPQ